MISVILIDPLDEKKQWVINPIAGLKWNTYYKSISGSLHLSVYDDPNFFCEIGYIVEIYEIVKNIAKRILRYRVYNLVKSHKIIEITAYDQLYYLTQSKDTLKIGYSTKEDRLKEYSLFQTKYNEEEQERVRLQLSGTQYDSMILPSYLILQFSKRYQLNVDYNLFEYDDFYEEAYKFLREKVFVNQKPIDMITYYMNLITILANTLYCFYDGNNGLCYQKITNRKKGIYFTEKDISNYQLIQHLVDGFVSMVEYNYTQIDYIPQQIEEIRYETYIEYEDKDGILYPVEKQREIKTYSTKIIMKPSEVTRRVDYGNSNKYGLFIAVENIAEPDKSRKDVLKTIIQPVKINLENPTFEEKMRERNAYYLSRQLPIYELSLTISYGIWDLRGGDVIGLQLETFNHKKIFIEVVIDEIEHIFNSSSDHIMNIKVKAIT